MGTFEINIADPECFNKIVQYMSDVAKRSYLLSRIRNVENWANTPTETIEQIHGMIVISDTEETEAVPF